jgi:gluconokinase
MPTSLLDSQYATLEPLQPDEPGVTVPVDGSVPTVMHRVMAALHLPYADTTEPLDGRNP